MRLGPCHEDNNRRRAVSKAMKSTTYTCPSCGRGQNKRPMNLFAEGVGLLWVCVYCRHEWTAGGRKASLS